MQPTREYKLPKLNVTASVQTDAGCVRETNEDNGRHVSPYMTEKQHYKGTLTIVADGMGGHSSGEVASEMAVELISSFYYADESTASEDALRNAIEQASHQIYETSVSDERFFGMGTTVVALVIQGNTALAAHVGDSRLYRLRERELELLTIDHSQVMEMVKQGILSMEEAQHHEDKNIILRAVGTQPNVEVEVSKPFSVEPGDEFLLCSDGLCDMVEDMEILDIWLNAGDIHAAGEQLINLAKERGGRDNITVGIVQVSTPVENVNGRKIPVTREIEV
jgi:serine/threonine protein phosphatase PrpC